MRRATDFGHGTTDHRQGISIHALHEESDQESTLSPLWAVFQSTLSMRRATLHHVAFVHDKAISIHALHEESDEIRKVKMLVLREFQSTLSMRRATQDHDRQCTFPIDFNPRSP